MLQHQCQNGKFTFLSRMYVRSESLIYHLHRTKGDGTRRYLSLSLTRAGENVPIGSHPGPLLVGTHEASSSAERQGPSSSPQITGSTAAPVEGDPNDLPQAIAQLDRVLARMAAALDDGAPPRYE